jgi:superfamily I DNA/RNA helicase
MPELTSQQQEFCAQVQDSASGLALIARAGTGKTYTLVQATHYLSQGSTPALALAFNKRIADELSQKMPDGVECRTMNSLGHRCWTKFLNRRAELDAQKLGGLVTSEVKARPNLRDEAWDNIRQLATKAKAHGIVPTEARGHPKSLHRDSPESWEHLCDLYDLDFIEEEIDLARSVLRQSIDLAFQGKIDFDDQIYMPTLWSGPFERYPVVFVDEAQDLTELQHEMLSRVLALKTGRLIAVGDPRQSIYGFRGAKQNSMATLEQRFALQPLPLTVSFRCPQRVVREAQRECPDIEPWTEAPEGQVGSLESWTLSDLPHGSVVLCRNNAPLMKLAYKLISSKVGVYFLGRDLGKGLTSLVKKLSGANSKSRRTSEAARQLPTDQLEELIEQWRSQEQAQALARDNMDKLERINDRANCILTLTPLCETVGELLDLIEEMFSRDDGKVALSTIHRAKGLEWKDVFFLDPWRVPPPRLRRRYDQDPERYQGRMDQERNLRYVAITRAQRSLTYIDLDNLDEED